MGVDLPLLGLECSTMGYLALSQGWGTCGLRAICGRREHL